VTIYSYVVHHDEGRRPNPYFKMCTLRGCKSRSSPGKNRNVEELAQKGDWVIGTGGAGKRSKGHGKLIYAMRVDETLTRETYFSDHRFARKKPVKTGTYVQTRGDNEEPVTDFEKHEQFALVSRYFWYFGANAIDIPERFHLEKNFRGFHYVDPEHFRSFLEWLREEYKPGKHGEPCGKAADELKGNKRCRSSC